MHNRVIHLITRTPERDDDLNADTRCRWVTDVGCEGAPSEPPSLHRAEFGIGDVYMHIPHRNARTDEIKLWVHDETG